MKTSYTLLAGAGFAAIAGLVVWASLARETVSTESVFDPPTAQATADAVVVAPAPVANTPADPLERAVRALSEQTAGVRVTPSPDVGPIARAEQAIARADAALAATDLAVAPAPPPPSDTAQSARLNALQARLDQLPR